MSYFSKKKEVVEEKKLPESSTQPYQPNTKGGHTCSESILSL